MHISGSESDEANGLVFRAFWVARLSIVAALIFGQGKFEVLVGFGLKEERGENCQSYSEGQVCDQFYGYDSSAGVTGVSMRRESDDEGDSGDCGNNSTAEQTDPVVNQDVELVDGQGAEKGEGEDDGWKLVDEVVRHPHEIPGPVIPSVLIFVFADALTSPSVPEGDGQIG